MNTTLLQDLAAHAARQAHEDHSTVPKLVALLVQTGDLPEPFASTAWLEPGSLEHECADLFHSGGMTRVYFDGSIEQYPD